VSVAAGAIATLAMASAFGGVFWIETEVKKGVVMFAGSHYDVAAVASVAAAGTAARNILFASEREAAIAAVARFYGDEDFVNKQDYCCSTRMLTNLPIRPRSRNSTVPGTVANKVSSLPRPTFLPGL
jgi:hypothetical protein